MLAKNLNVSPGRHTYKNGINADLKSRKRYARSLGTDFKRRRLFLKQQKNELKKKKELLEGPSYQTDSQLHKTVDTYLPLANIVDQEPLIVFFILKLVVLRKLQIYCKLLQNVVIQNILFI